ncbi:hypothetical protein IJG04_03425 [Candidatus Saccharibacteria bacterium]|nr:hypothetical protein [Candidatus Saccharibacteria bacterium]
MAKTLIYELPLQTIGGLYNAATLIPILKSVGVDYLWLPPIYPSTGGTDAYPEDIKLLGANAPTGLNDFGYGVDDYKAIDGRYGTMADFELFAQICHEHDIKILMDLPMNHTSINHLWFLEDPYCYCWSHDERPNWRNHFNDKPAWAEVPADKLTYLREQYSFFKRGPHYLHSFSPAQADLNWFPGDNLSTALVRRFRFITEFWMNKGVAGFRLDAVQALNKDLRASSMKFEDLLFSNERAFEVINAVFPSTADRPRPFLIAEIFDPTFGNIAQKYRENTPVNFTINALLPNMVDESWGVFKSALSKTVRTTGSAIAVESHDTPRFTSRSGKSTSEILETVLSPNAEAVIIYAGQELGLCNPNLPTDIMAKLDTQFAMQVEAGKLPDNLHATARANARVMLDLSEWERQSADPNSSLNVVKCLIKAWKKGWMP